MAHWGWYWKIKKKHKPKALCSGFLLCEIDSFKLFGKTARPYHESIGRICFEIPMYQLKALLAHDGHLVVTYSHGSYHILIEKKSPNYGGFYYFFHCPRCNARMRKLYCIEGRYLCRKCANLGYYIQRLRPSERYSHMCSKVKAHLLNRAGTLEQKPPRMKRHTFQKLRIKYVKFDEKRHIEWGKEGMAWFGPQMRNHIEWYFPPGSMLDAWVERDYNFPNIVVATLED